MERAKGRQCRPPVSTVVYVGAIVRRVLPVEPDIMQETLLPVLPSPLYLLSAPTSLQSIPVSRCLPRIDPVDRLRFEPAIALSEYTPA